MAAAPVELWSTRLSCPQLHRRISSLPQPLPSATLGEPENPSLNSDPGCIKVVDTYRLAAVPPRPLTTRRVLRARGRPGSRDDPSADDARRRQTGTRGRGTANVES